MSTDQPTLSASNRSAATACVRAADQAPPAAEETHRIGLPYLSILAFAVGIVTGLGAVAFRDLIGFVHNLLFLGQFVVRYDANLFTPPSPWGPFVILAPVIGALAVTFLVTKFAPEAQGHGVPEVMDAIYYRGGVIRPIVAFVKSLASAIAIGSGAAVGREGPIIQIGSALGSTVGQIVRMLPGRITLVAAGAGAGIAATFNTPIGGVMFAVELMMPEVSVRTFLPVAIATGTATFVGRLFFGQQPAFIVPPPPLENTDVTAALLRSSMLCSARSPAWPRQALFAVCISLKTSSTVKHPYARHALGMLLVGILIYLLQVNLGHYYVEGVGYATVQAIVFGQLASAWLLALLFLCKLLATTVSLGSGSSGGIFSPSLFMGATIGGAFASALAALHLPLGINIPAFAMVGMAAMVGGGTGAAMTAVTMIFEMTRDYNIVLPMILAVAFSLGVRRPLSPENIYTLKLSRRGHLVPKALHANMFLVRRASEVMERDILVLPAETAFDGFRSRPDHSGRMRHVIVTRGNRIFGVARVNTGLRRGLDGVHTGITLGDVARPNFTIVHANDVGFEVIQRIWRKRAVMALVVSGRGVPRPDKIIGVITKEHVADSVATSVQIYPS